MERFSKDGKLIIPLMQRKRGTQRADEREVRYVVTEAYCPNGCNIVDKDEARWNMRRASLRDGRIRSGMGLKEFLSIWGLANDSQQSRYPERTYLTLIYHDNYSADGIAYLHPFKTYYFEFVNNRLESWHVL